MAENTTYTTKANVKTYLGIPTATTTWDTLIDSLISIASRMIDNFTNRRFHVTDSDETKYFDGNGEVSLFIDDLISVTSIAIDNVTLEATDYHLLPYNSDPKTEIQRDDDSSSDGHITWPSGQKNITIVGKWGYCETEDRSADIEFACRELVSDIFRNRKMGKLQSESVQGYNYNYGSVKALPEVVQHILKKYKKAIIPQTDSAKETYIIND